MNKLLIVTFAAFIGLALGGFNSAFAADCGCACAKTCNCGCEKTVEQCECHCCKKGDCNCGSECKCHSVEVKCGCNEDCNCSCKDKKMFKKMNFFKKHMKCECEKKIKK